MILPSGSLSAGSFASRSLAQLFSRALAKKRDGMAVGGDQLLVLDPCHTESLLHSPTRVPAGPPSSPWHTYRIGVWLIVVSLRLTLAVHAKDSDVVQRCPGDGGGQSRRSKLMPIRSRDRLVASVSRAERLTTGMDDGEESRARGRASVSSFVSGREPVRVSGARASSIPEVSGLDPPVLHPAPKQQRGDAVVAALGRKFCLDRAA